MPTRWPMLNGALWAFLLAWGARCCREIDVLFNVVFLFGEENQTVSDHAALAEDAGATWGCWLCWFLSKTVQKAHCKVVQLTGYVPPGFVYFRAGIWFALFSFLLYSVVHTLLDLL